MGLSGIGRLLNDVYTLEWWRVLLLAWLISPGMMFVVGYFCESRIIKIGKGQSFMFLPGDFFLGVILSSAVYCTKWLPEQGWWQSHWWSLAVAVVAVGVVTLMRTVIDAPNYPPRSRTSPTKWYHDVGCYGVLLWAIVTVAVPSMFSSPWHTQKLWMWVGLAGWIGGGVVDTTLGGIFKSTPEVRHPSNWRWQSYNKWADIGISIFIGLGAVFCIVVAP